MASPWVLLKDVVEAVEQTSGSEAWPTIQARLRRGEVRAQAGVMREFHLVSITCTVPNNGSPDEVIYLGSTERALWLRADTSGLSTGESQISLRGYHYTIGRHEDAVTIYWESALLKKSTHAEITPDFWVSAVADIASSLAFSDDVHGGVRSEVSNIVLSREDLGVLWPSLPAEHEPLRPPETPRPPERKRGRKEVYDWRGALIHVARVIHDDGLPKEPKDLIEVILDWFAAEDMHPDRGEVGKLVRRIFDEFGQ